MAPVSNDDIRWLVSLVMGEGLAELEVTQAGSGVLVRRTAAAPPAVVTTSVPPASALFERPDLVSVKAPMAGIFYRSSAPDSPPFVEEGDEVQQGETVALIEAMKLYNDLEAPCSGRVEKILAADASRVAADETIMYLKPSEGT